jgi:crotonobetainyl-CoA:carnitine CoA-transferase CaiB-like acyl-CoA transferase
MERLGIGWEPLHASNPRLVHTSISGYGQSGPLATLPGFDPIFQAQSGLMAAQGGADDPVFHMVAYNDYAAGALGALATLAALFARERTGRGQRVDVSLFRTSYVAQALDMIECAARPAPVRGGRDYAGPSAARRIYPVADGFVCVAAATPAQAAALGRLAGTTVALADPADGPAAEAIARALAGSSRAAALEQLAAAGVPAAPCIGFQELFTDPRLRGRIVEQEHPVLGPLVMPGAFVDLDATPVVLRRSAPVLGADGDAVLAEIGYGPERIARLVADGVVGRPA